MKQKILSTLLALALCLTLLPTAVLADGTSNSTVAQIGSTAYETFDAAYNAAKSGDTITLLANCTAEEQKVIYDERNFTLDLNGHQLSGTLTILGVDLTLTDSGSNGSVAKIVANVGSLTVTNGAAIGELEANNPAVDFALYDGTFQKITTKNGLTIGSLLMLGYGFRDDAGTWYDQTSTATTIETKVVAQQLPIQSLIIKDDTDEDNHTSLTAEVTLSSNFSDKPITYQWYRVTDGTASKIDTATTKTLAISEKSGVAYYQCQVTCNGYSQTAQVPVQSVSVSYLDHENGETKTKFLATYTTITTKTTELTDGWYVVSGEVDLSNTILLLPDSNSDIHLILCDNAELKLKGIQSKNSVGSYMTNISLNIYAQSEGAKMGKLTVTGFTQGTDPAGYGIDLTSYKAPHKLTIHGGNISVTGGAATEVSKSGQSLAICLCGDMTVYGGNLTVTGGNVTCTNGNCNFSTGIYLSSYGKQSNMIVHGGTIVATGGDATDSSCGISISSGDLTVTGGDITAIGGKITGTNVTKWANRDSCGIIVLSNNYASTGSFGGNVTVTGGTITAIGQDASYIYTATAHDNDSMWQEHNTAYVSSYGIGVGASMTVSGGSTVSGTGGKASLTFNAAEGEDDFVEDEDHNEATSYGIMVNGPMTISGTTTSVIGIADDVTATIAGGEVVAMSCGIYALDRYDYNETTGQPSASKQAAITVNGGTVTVSGGNVTIHGTASKTTQCAGDLCAPSLISWSYDGETYHELTLPSSVVLSGGKVQGKDRESVKVYISGSLTKNGGEITLTEDSYVGNLNGGNNGSNGGDDSSNGGGNGGSGSIGGSGSGATGSTSNKTDTSKNFSDVKPSDYFADAVAWASKQAITGGISATEFGPNASCTRAQLVTFLWRAADCPEPKAMNSFTDVAANAYYAKAVAWAAENGIVDGYGNGLFGSEDTITREQMAVILYRFAKTTGMDTTQGGMAVREYSDFERISDYAVSAMQWAVNAGILQGYDSKLMPQQPCTRAQIVTMLYRLLG